MIFNVKDISAVAVVFISGAALLGCWTEHAALATWLPGTANITFNTALSFMLVALACCIPTRRLRHVDSIKIAAGTLVGLFAMLTLIQDTFSVNLGMDNLLFNFLGTALTSPHPGRMSPNTAAGFLFSGLILVLLTTGKQAFITITHALILFIAMLSLLGVGMNVLISDVPANFAHFASMSLFTATSFLLLSISFLSLHQKQTKNNGIDSILHSGVQLMYRLRYPGKFMLISMVMLVPLAMLMWNELSLLKQEVEQDKGEIIGIEHIQKTSQLIKAIPEHRGMLNAHLASPNVFGSTIAQKTAEIDLLFASNNAMDQSHTALIKIPDTWHLITDRWATIKANHQNPMTSWRMHTEIIALLGKHLRDIGSVTLLSYDHDPLVHNLVAAQLEILPQLFEQIGQLRGQGSGFIARKHISREQQMMLEAMVSQISLLLKESEQLIAKSLPDKENHALKALARDYARLTRKFLAIANKQLLTGNAISISPEDFFSQASQALAAGYAFNHASLKHVQNLLEQRINNSITAQYTIQLSAMLVILLILYLFAAFYQSIMNTIRALAHAAEQMKRGEVDALAALPVKDEMGDIVGSFNAIAEELMRVSSHMSAVVKHAVDGIITIDQPGLIQSFNPASEHIFGYVCDEVIGQNITMLMPENYRDRHLTGLQHYCATGEGNMVGKTIDLIGLRKNGDEFPMELSINAMSIDRQQMFIGMVHCDTNQVQQVLMNMMNNARDALEERTDKQIIVRLEICHPDADFFQRHDELVETDYACLSITDSGHGMDTEMASKIFDPFFTTKEAGKGTGLGLSTAFGTITSHHGTIEVDSQIGNGTSFRIYLPVVKTAGPDSENGQEQQAAHSSKHETLLLVDDEPVLLHSMQDVLEELGYHVINACNGKQGLEQFLKYQHRIDAIITDVVMPEMSGVEMFRQIRAINNHIPTIFMTGYDRGKIALRDDEQANTTIISKPVQIPDLSHHIESILKQ